MPKLGFLRGLSKKNGEGCNVRDVCSRDPRPLRLQLVFREQSPASSLSLRDLGLKNYEVGLRPSDDLTCCLDCSPQAYGTSFPKHFALPAMHCTKRFLAGNVSDTQDLPSLVLLRVPDCSRLDKAQRAQQKKLSATPYRRPRRSSKSVLLSNGLT